MKVLCQIGGDVEDQPCHKYVDEKEESSGSFVAVRLTEKASTMRMMTRDLVFIHRHITSTMRRARKVIVILKYSGAYEEESGRIVSTLI